MNEFLGRLEKKAVAVLTESESECPGSVDRMVDFFKPHLPTSECFGLMAFAKLRVSSHVDLLEALAKRLGCNSVGSKALDI